ncbi:MAG: DUF2058 family protein [Halothiobacillaceae bacterium]
MSNPFQEQFLKAGLVNDQQVKKARTDQRKGKKKAGGKPAPDEARLAAEQARQRKAEADRARERARQAQAQAREKAAQVAQLIQHHAQPHGRGDISYHFVDPQRKIQRLMVDRRQQQQLAQGALVIVANEGRYALVAREGAEKIRQRDPQRIVVDHRGREEIIDPAYAAFPIPDELVL